MSKYYRPISGLSLDNSSDVVDYKSGNLMDGEYDDSFLFELYQDDTNRLIGSVPKIGESKPESLRLKDPSFVSEYKAGNLSKDFYKPGSTEESASQPSKQQDFGKIAAQAGTVASDLMNANSNLSRTEYQNDLAYWEGQGKYWFNPYSDVEPDLESYMDMMPSSTESLEKGTLTGGALGGGEAEYVFNKAGQRAVQGSALGPWGAAAGGAIGIVEGLFSWGAAEEEEKKHAKRAQSQFERALKEWTIRKNRRLSSQRQQGYDRRVSEREKREAKEKAKKREKAVGISERRRQMMDVLMNAGNVSKAARQERLARWN